MAEPVRRDTEGWTAASGEPLIALIFEEDGREVVRYFRDDEAADAAMPPDSVQAARALARAWSDLDWDQTVEALERIRHESTPSPFIEP